MSYTRFEGCLPYGYTASMMGITDKTSYERIGWNYEEKQTVPIDGGYSTIVPEILAFEPTNGQITIKASFISTIVTKNPSYVEGGTEPKYLFENTYDRSKDKQFICNKNFNEIDGSSKAIAFVDYLKQNGEFDQDISNGMSFAQEGEISLAFIVMDTPFDEEENYYLNSISTDLDELFEDESVTSVNLYTPIFDITIDYLYKQSKLDGKWVDIDSITEVKTPIYINSDDQVAIRYSNQSGWMGTSYSCLTTISDMYDNSKTSLAVDRSQLCTQIAGDGMENNGSTLKLKNASQTNIGGIKIAASGDTLYISNDGNDPIR